MIVNLKVLVTKLGKMSLNIYYAPFYPKPDFVGLLFYFTLKDIIKSIFCESLDPRVVAGHLIFFPNSKSFPLLLSFLACSFPIYYEYEFLYEPWVVSCKNKIAGDRLSYRKV